MAAAALQTNSRGSGEVVGHPAKSKQTDTAIRGVPQHSATEGATWRHPKLLLEMLLNGRTGYLKSWSWEQFKWQEGNTK